MSTPLEDDEGSIARRLRTVQQEASRAAAFYRVDVGELEECLDAKLPSSIAHLEASYLRCMCRIRAGNAAIDLIRQRRRCAEALKVAVEHKRVRDPFGARSGKALRAGLEINGIPRRIRSAVDSIKWKRKFDGKIENGYTVLLMQLRLMFARRIADCAGDLASESSASTTPFVASAFIARCVVWTESDLQQQFGCDACKMSTAWAHTVPVIDQPPHWLKAKAFVQHIQPLAPRLSYVAWRKAASRAMKKFGGADAELYYRLTVSKEDDK